jgi:hypothetical protein
MAVWIGLKGKDDILYGTIETYQYQNKVDRQIYACWYLHLYYNERGRKQGLIRHKRENPDAVFINFELKVADIVNTAEIVTVVPKEKHVNDDNLRFTKKIK